MKISPLDIRKQTFRTVFRGADNEEVRVFLDLVATECESMLQENAQLTERVQHCEDRLVEYRQLDQTLRNSLLTAERLSAEAKEASQREANLILQDAEWRAKQMLEDARERLGRLTEEIRELQSKKEAFTQHLRSFLKGQLELLDRNEDFLRRVDHLADEAQVLNSQVRRVEMDPPSTAGKARAAEARTSDAIPDVIPPAEPKTRGETPSISHDTQPGVRSEQTAARSTGRGFGRFAAGQDEKRSSEDSIAPAPTSPATGPQGPERDEGFFEFSADEEDEGGGR